MFLTFHVSGILKIFYINIYFFYDINNDPFQTFISQVFPIQPFIHNHTINFYNYRVNSYKNFSQFLFSNIYFEKLQIFRKNWEHIFVKMLCHNVTM